MKHIHFITLLFITLLLPSCWSPKKSSAPEYTTKKVSALDQFYYECNGYSYNTYMCYFGDNTGFARVFVLQYGVTLGYKDTWFDIRINDTFDGLTYTPKDDSILDDVPFHFETSKTKNYSVGYSQYGYMFPIRVREIDKENLQEDLSSVRIPLELEYPN